MLPISKIPIERPTVQVPLEDSSASAHVETQPSPALSKQQHNDGSANAPVVATSATRTVQLKECGLCATRSDSDVWTANPPDRPEAENEWVSVLETPVHASCFAQAVAEKMVLQIPTVERLAPSRSPSTEDHREFATRCFEPTDKLPMECVMDGAYPVFNSDVEAMVRTHGSKEIGVTAVQPFATGFRIFPQLAPPRTLEDLIQCTSTLNKNGRLAESSLPLDVRKEFPEIFTELKKSIPLYTLPGGPCDVLMKDPRNRTRASAVKLSILSPGSVIRAHRSRYRTALLAATPGSQLEWGAINHEDAERILEASRALRSKDDVAFVPDFAFCIRKGARVFCGVQTQPGQLMLAFPGAIYWGFVRGDRSTQLIHWAFAERSKLAFEYALSDPLVSSHPEELLELDSPEGHADDMLNLGLFHEILKTDDERMSLLPKDLAEAICQRLVRACQDTPVDATRGSTTLIPPRDHADKQRCDTCRCELFGRRVYCSECESEGQDPSRLIDLVATHPPRSSSKKDRSTLPEWLRVGCRVLVNLTVSGNSNDKPPRVVGASHLPAIILKTGHGFFTVYLEGAGEQVVKRKAAIEPHPYGPQLATSYSVKVKTEGGGVEPVIQRTPFIEAVYCVDCFSRNHSGRKHRKQNTVYLDSRNENLKIFEQWKRDIIARSAIRKDDLCMWNPKSVPSVNDQIADEPPLPLLAVRVPTVSHEAGQDAVAQAQIMGPSPYHYPVPGQHAVFSSSSTGASIAAPTATTTSAANQSLIISGGMERRSRQAAKRRLWGGESMVVQQQTQQNNTSQQETIKSAPQQQHSNRSSKEQSSSSQHANKKFKSALPAVLPPENDLFSTGQMDSHFFSAGLNSTPATHRGVNLALRDGSFFVGGQKSLSILLEADAVVKAHAELMDANKPDEIREIWSRARLEVPLRKMWRFLPVEATTSPPTAPFSAAQEPPSASFVLDQHQQVNAVLGKGKDSGIHALAESAANAEPA